MMGHVRIFVRIKISGTLMVGPSFKNQNNDAYVLVIVITTFRNQNTIPTTIPNPLLQTSKIS